MSVPFCFIHCSIDSMSKLAARFEVKLVGGVTWAPLHAALRFAFLVRAYHQRGLDVISFIYYMEESVLLGTKPLVDSIRHFIRDPSGVFSVCHLYECRIVK